MHPILLRRFPHSLRVLGSAALILTAIIGALYPQGRISAQGPAIIQSGHVDIGVAYEDGAWDLHVHDETADKEYEPGEAILRVAAAAKASVPAGPQFAACLGTAGSPVWVLPQVQNPSLIFLGHATEEIASGVFADDKVTFSLKSKSGPGEFCFYQSDAFGEPTILFNTRDGMVVTPNCRDEREGSGTRPGTRDGR